MKRCLICFLVMAGVLCGNVFGEEYRVDGKSAVLIEQNTGQVLFYQNKDEKLPPASVTKIMTLLLIYDAVEQGKIGWEDKVTVSEEAAGMGGSQIFLEPNEVQSVRDLTKSIAIASANDAAVAMAEFIGGSEAGFVDMMNKRAKELGMNNTNFENACGLDSDGHYTTAYDIGLMSRELLNKYPQVKEYTTTWQDTITHTTNKGNTEFGLTNTNKFIKWYEGATGLKTGSTSKALYCLSGSAERNGLNLIGVIMAAPDPKVRFREMMKLMDYGFGTYTIVNGETAGTRIGEIPVYKGKADSVTGIVKETVSIPAKKDSDTKLSHKLKVAEGVEAPVKKGSKVGEIIYYNGDKQVGKSDIIAGEEVEKAGLFDSIKKLSRKWVGKI